MSGSKSKRKGKNGESNAKKFLKKHKCYIAMTEIQGLAGDDSFMKDPTGKWWSLEVKNTNSSHPKFIAQARRQAEDRYHALQEELRGENAELYYALGLHTYRKSDWALVWHPSGYGVSTESWVVFYNDNGRTAVKVLDNKTGWDLSHN